MPLIEFSNISKIYRAGDEKIHALDDVSFEIKKGEFVSICGPSGSGKSTLLSVLGLLNTPTEGKLTIDDIAVYDLSTEEKADFRSDYIGFIFQAFQLIPYLTAMENVMLPLVISDLKTDEKTARSKKMLEKVGLARKLDKLPNQLSGGEIQRVAIARALVNEPPILLADEPTGNLDSKNSAHVMELLKELNGSGKTVIVVTHEEKTARQAEYTLQVIDGKIMKEKEVLK